MAEMERDILKKATAFFAKAQSLGSQTYAPMLWAGQSGSCAKF